MAKRKAAAGTRKGRKTAKKKSAAPSRRPAARKAVARKSARRSGRKAVKAAKRAKRSKPAAMPRPKAKAARRSPAKAASRSAKAAAPRKAPALNRERRIVQDDDIVPTPPSSLDLDRNASAARTGRHALRERLNEHTETSPAMTAGDVDADWESAYSVGDEAPGGDNPTPDQDVVDDIGRAVGVQYEDNEELKGEAKISKRDKHRWELDPASSEDYEDR